MHAVNVLADHVAASDMRARHISELRRDLVPDPDIALLAQLSTAAGISLRCGWICRGEARCMRVPAQCPCPCCSVASS
jgi:hypothetical protein